MRWTLEPDGTAGVPAVRRSILRHLARAAGPDEDLWAAEIVVAELLANAVAHGRAPARVTLTWKGPHPRLTVVDSGPGFRPGTDRVSAARLPEDPLAEGGRGLYLIAQLARDVRVGRSLGGGSVVAVTLDLHRRPAD